LVEAPVLVDRDRRSGNDDYVEDGIGDGWAAGEQSLAVAMRRHWVHAGAPKTAISFCGYWRSGAHR